MQDEPPRRRPSEYRWYHPRNQGKGGQQGEIMKDPPPVEQPIYHEGSDNEAKHIYGIKVPDLFVHFSPFLVDNNPSSRYHR